MILLIITAVVAMIIIEYFNRKRWFALREQLGLDGPKPHLFFGNMGTFFEVVKEKGIQATGTIYPMLREKYGDIYGLYFGSYLEIVITDPEIIKEVFITQFGNFVARKKIAINMVYPLLDSLLQVDHEGTMGSGWKEQRSVISNIFSSGKMKKMHCMFHDQLDDLIGEMRKKSRVNGGCMDIYGEYQAMTMDMIARCALGQTISCIKDRTNDFYIYARRFFSNVSYHKSIVFRLSLFFPFLKYLRPYTTFGKAEKVLLKQLSDIIRQRQAQRAAGQIRELPDIIDLILIENEKRLLSGNDPLHHDVIVSNAWALFLAGYETTSTALGYASHLLAAYPEAQETLYEEIISTFGKNEPIDYERVMKLPYLHAVFCETIRIRPPVITFTGRRCIKETVIGGKIRVPVGVSVVTPVHAIMWNEKFYDEPDKFIPERFLDENKPSWCPTYMPFGIGPRNCVGARFAEMEFKTVLAEVTRRFVTMPDPVHTKLETVTSNVLLTPLNNEVFVKLVERNN